MSDEGIDLFAGGGGFTEGAEQAGVRIIWAANHWPAAVETHARNHPHTVHVLQDLHQADWSLVPPHSFLCASPACTGHTKARGKDKPHHDTARSTGWAVVSALEYHRPEVAVVENVIEFLQWTLYKAWELAVQALGYCVSVNIVDAADYGVPQNRIRVIIVLTRSKRPFKLRNPRHPHVPISSVIDWADGRWSPIDKPGRSQATLRRIANGRARFGRRFLIPFYSSGSGLTGRSLDRPIGTITTRDRWALVDGDQIRMLTLYENKLAMGFRREYWLPDDHKTGLHLCGNAIPPPLAQGVFDQLKRSA